MELVETAHIKSWPEEVKLAVSEHKNGLSTEILSPHERDEYHSFKNPHRKNEYLLARHLFRFLLNELGIAPEQVKLQKEKKGKPYAVYGDEIIHVSFSHTNEMVMCSISRNREIGLDTEAESRSISDKVIKRILNEKEWETIGHENPLKLWTIKEAALKCVGTGLQTKIKNLSIKKRETNQYLIRFNDEFYIEICSFKLSSHQIALAYQSTNI